MRIRTKISLLVVTLIAAVVGSIAANLFWLEQRRVRADFSGRVDALLEGVLRISRESLTTQDELMLLSYLKFLMQDYPEIKLVIVSRQGHVSLLGDVIGPDLFYRTLTITERKAAQYRSAPGKWKPSAPLSKDAVTNSSAADQPIPPNTFTIQIGFSKTMLDAQVRKAQRALALQVSAITLVGLFFGILGALWLGRLLSRPVAALAAAAQDIGEGKLDTVVETHSRDELGALAGQFNRMAVKLRDLIRFKEDLFGTLSHELNTPLTGLKGFLDYLQKSRAAQDPQERREAYETMSEAVRQMEISLGNALQLFAAGAHPVLLRPETLCVNDILTEAIRLYQPMAQTGAIALSGPFGPPELRVSADREMLRRVFINLVSNALKYTPPGGSVKVALEEDAGGVRVSVADTGSGIAPEDQEKIFTKFYRAPGPDGRRQMIPGSGLGLAIAKQAVDLHKGRIWVQSEPGRGSVFYVSLSKAAAMGPQSSKDGISPLPKRMEGV
ncbi:MAG: HAMP domain-containing histidine kinase [Elusimicrobia bacterium]|nr:HAMP domain-containing histidine kinase [Elusimicrobiota bacterium]